MGADVSFPTSVSQFVGIISTNTNQTACESLEDVVHGQIILPLGASLSILCYLFLFYLYFVVDVPALKRHPTSKYRENLNGCLKLTNYDVSSCCVEVPFRIRFHPAIPVDSVRSEFSFVRCWFLEPNLSIFRILCFLGVLVANILTGRRNVVLGNFA